MPLNRKKALQKLYRVADGQRGFFTTKQAVESGFSARSHLYHVQTGDWIREHRGIYRLRQFPSPERPDLILWYLWSRNRKDHPEGLYSHETALSLHDLSDTMPAKLHMTVPKSFRRNSQIPRALVLHYGNLPETDIESIQGIRATKPLRTVIDLLLEGRVSKDILIQALREGLRRGLISQTAIKQASLPNEAMKELQQLIKAANA